MFQPRSIQSSLSFSDKIKSIDYILLLSVLILGIISMFAMYSTAGGSFDYHTQSHIVRFFLFFSLFLILSFFRIRFWSLSSSNLFNFYFSSSRSKICMALKLLDHKDG